MFSEEDDKHIDKGDTNIKSSQREERLRLAEPEEPLRGGFPVLLLFQGSLKQDVMQSWN